MKKLLSFILAVLLITFTVLPFSAKAAGGSLDHFTTVNDYINGQFADVADYAWYAPYIRTAYEYGLVKGDSSSKYSPARNLTSAEAIKMAVCLHSVYYNGKISVNEGSPWYEPYVNYALKNGILTAPMNHYGAAVTRAQFAELITNSLPEEALKGMNTIADNAIPDVSLADSWGGAVYQLFRAGILTGCDSYGTFKPNKSLTRAEAAAILARASNPAFRRSLVLPPELTGEQLYERCSSASFYIERYDTEGFLMGIGSGFFITSDGLAVTNYHVISGSASAKITTADGTTYNVLGIYDYDEATDLALLQIDGSGFDYLGIGNSDSVTEGEGVFAIGSPYGLVNSISKGIVSAVSREINGSPFIQYTAPISLGSGGGPVLNTSGQVIGVTCLSAMSGQTVNFAIPSNFIGALDRTGYISLIAHVSETSEKTVYYKGYYPVPDYGVFLGVPLYKAELNQSADVKSYYYRQSDIPEGADIAFIDYTQLLTQNGFEWQKVYKNDAGYDVVVYHHPAFECSVHVGVDIKDSVECRFVSIF
jgi:S1-C subfamily serine protease